MGKVTLEQVLEQAKMLTPDEQRQLQKALDALLELPPPKTPQERLAQKLLEVGLLSRIPPPITDFTPFENRKPVEVKGKPVSEILIEERR
jgi:hypothetical protein